MTIKDMKTTTCSCPDIHLSLSTCQWHSLKTWRHKQQKDSEDHQPHHGNGLQVPRSRHKHSTCCVGEYLYLVCGKDGTSPLKDMWRFHIQKQKWELVELGGGSLPYLQGHTTVAYKRMILIFGGTFTDTLGDVQLWTYNTDLGHLREVWIEPGAPQPLPRRDHSAVVHNNLMYVYGGFVDSNGACTELWAFNIDEEEWTQLTTMCRNQPGRRYGHSAVVSDNAMWLYGGMAGLSPRSDLWKYSFSMHQWRKIKVLGTAPSLSGHAACVIHGQMIVVGGNSQGKPVSDVWSLSFDTCTWQKLTSSGTTLLPRLSFHSCVTFCPAHAVTQQSVGMTRSTPYLKPPTTEHQLRPDLFVVRPRTSPAANSTEVSSAKQQTGLSVGSSQSQVMIVSRDREMDSCPARLKEAIEDENTGGDDFCDRLDARVHVSHKEQLVPALPEEPCFYDSCLPISLEEKDCSPLNEQILQENTWPMVDSCVTPLQHIQIMPHHLSNGIPTVSDDIAEQSDLINFCDSKSDSPVLRTSTRPKSADVQNMFRHDLFVEDLESVEGNGLDEVKISYPSKNAVQLLPVPGSGDDIGLSHGSSCSSMQQHHLPPDESLRLFQHAQPCSQLHHKNETIQLQHFKTISADISSPLSDRSILNTNHKEPYSTLGTQAQESSNTVTQSPEQHLSPEAQVTLMYQTAPTPDQSLRQSQQRSSGRKSSAFPKSSSSSDSGSSSYETETSFIDNLQFGQDTALSVSTRSENGQGLTLISPVNHHNVSGNSVVTAQQFRDSKQLTDKTAWVRNTHTNAPRSGMPAITREMVVDEAFGGTASSGRSYTRKEVEQGEPFLLVIGGRMEEQGSLHTKPIAMWKGVFV